jgi:hypothetical protein
MGILVDSGMWDVARRCSQDDTSGSGKRDRNRRPRKEDTGEMLIRTLNSG